MECPSLIYFTDNTARPYTYKSFEENKIDQWLALQQAPMFRAITNESELQDIIQKVEYPTYFVLKLANAVSLPEYERELSTVKGMGAYGVMNAPATQFYAVREGIKVPFVDKYQEAATDDLDFEDMI
mgnify:CR=1 FL=1